MGLPGFPAVDALLFPFPPSRPLVPQLQGSEDKPSPSPGCSGAPPPTDLSSRYSPPHNQLDSLNPETWVPVPALPHTTYVALDK